MRDYFFQLIFSSENHDVRFIFPTCMENSLLRKSSVHDIFFDSDFPFFFHDRCRKCRTHHFYFYRRLLDYDVIAYFAGCKCLC